MRDPRLSTAEAQARGTDPAAMSRAPSPGRKLCPHKHTAPWPGSLPSCARDSGTRCHGEMEARRWQQRGLRCGVGRPRPGCRGPAVGVGKLSPRRVIELDASFLPRAGLGVATILLAVTVSDRVGAAVKRQLYVDPVFFSEISAINPSTSSRQFLGRPQAPPAPRQRRINSPLFPGML